MKLRSKDSGNIFEASDAVVDELLATGNYEKVTDDDKSNDDLAQAAESPRVPPGSPDGRPPSVAKSSDPSAPKPRRRPK